MNTTSLSTGSVIPTKSRRPFSWVMLLMMGAFLGFFGAYLWLPLSSPVPAAVPLDYPLHKDSERIMMVRSKGATPHVTIGYESPRFEPAFISQKKRFIAYQIEGYLKEAGYGNAWIEGATDIKDDAKARFNGVRCHIEIGVEGTNYGGDSYQLRSRVFCGGYLFLHGSQSATSDLLVMEYLNIGDAKPISGVKELREDGYQYERVAAIVAQLEQQYLAARLAVSGK